MSYDADPQRLYPELLALTQEGDSFYLHDYGPYRVFNYRLASYSEWLKPSALEARGCTFYMKEGQEPVLVCRPFKKFFNLDENPMTMGLDLKTVHKWAVKEDGSIISSYIDQETGELRLKSKQSLVSEQAEMAMKFISVPIREKFKAEVLSLTKQGYTVMFEYVSPANRIVLEYQETELRVIGVRNMHGGNCLSKTLFADSCPEIYARWVKEFSPNEIKAEQVDAMTDIEGFVGTLESGLMFKIKTNWYKTLHHLKDSIETPRRLFDAIIDECVDDVKAMFSTDTFTLGRIAEMEAKVIPVYNGMISYVEKFYEENKHLERKDYAIKGQTEAKGLFSLVMGKYTGKCSTYQEFAKKHREEIFGISVAKDEPITK